MPTRPEPVHAGDVVERRPDVPGPPTDLPGSRDSGTCPSCRTSAGRYGRLVAHGVTLLNGPVDRPWGRRTAAFADPSGNVWEVAQILPDA